MRRTHCAFVAMLILASQACGRTAVGETPQQPTAEPTLPGSPIPMSTEVVPTAPLSYPFEGRNMFFGLTMISRPEDGLVARELGVSWVSLQPLVVWFALEQQPGVYNWAPLDREILYLQSLQVDPTMALFPWNLFGDERLELTALLEEQAAADGYSDLAATFQAFLRHSPEADAWQLYPHDDTLPLWLDFIRAAVARYNGDGVDDMPGLRYPIRNWHLVEEYPFPGFGDAENYVQILIPTYQAVKSEDPSARVILPGLAGNFSRVFAFADGFIEDPEGGVWNGFRFTQEQLAANATVRSEMDAFRSILRDGLGYYDVADIHLYEETDTFIEGKIAWLQHALEEVGADVPIWCIEGGGPFRNPPGVESPYGDPHFGEWSAEENAEYVVKLHVLAAAAGLERDHWSLVSNPDTAYWNGPWTVMGLMTSERQRRPAFYAFQIMLETLNGFEGVEDLGFDGLRLFRFLVAGEPVYVAWSSDEDPVTYDLSGSLEEASLSLTPIVTELASDGSPHWPEVLTVEPTAIPLSMTPVFLE